MPRPLARTLRALLYTVATLIILWLALIETPMWLTRLHAQHLLADFQSIKANQSDWADAQRLMHRWGRWGHYDGACTPAACEYSILIEDATTKWMSYLVEREWVNPMGRSAPFFIGVQYLGLHSTTFDVTFTVRNGKIVKTRSDIILAVPPPFRRETDDYGYGLLLRTQVRSHLRQQPIDEHQMWILGSDEQLDDHPDYKTGRPSGCTGCISLELTYTPALQHPTVVRLTSLNLSCITRLHPCREPEDLLLAARDWQFHRYDSNGRLVAPPACRTEPRARARDAIVVLEVDALSTRTVQIEGYESSKKAELDKVRILQVLKGEHKDQPGDEVSFLPFNGEYDSDSIELPEHLEPGKHYFLFLDSDIHAETWKNLEADRCGVLESTPANLDQIKLGIAQDTPETPDPRIQR